MLLSADNLCQDLFIRSCMDVEGYLPIPYVCNLPFIACYGAPYENIVNNLISNPFFEVDTDNETMRLKINWNQVIFIIIELY